MKATITKQKTFFYFPIAIIVTALAVKIVFTRFYSLYISGEDGFVEYFQFAFYFVSSTLAIALAIRHFKNKWIVAAICYLLVAAGLFFISMEEISWGQRIFDFQTPGSLEETNVQGELTLHNIDFFHRYLLHPGFIVIGLIGGYGWKLIPQISKDRYKDFFSEFIPEKTLMLYFLPTFFLYSYLQFIRPIEMEITDLETSLFWPGDQEVVELILSLGVLIFFIGKFKHRKEK